MYPLYAQKLENGAVLVEDHNGKALMLFQNTRSDKPTKRNKYIMYNCARYSLRWKN